MQVLWHTAAAYARRLMELCSLGSEEVRERVADKARKRRAADAAAEVAAGGSGDGASDGALLVIAGRTFGRRPSGGPCN